MGSGFWLTLNGQRVDVDASSANLTLSEFIRGHTLYKSVKVGCSEGGCGACAVAVVVKDEGATKLKTINSCLTPVYLINGQSLLTAEGIPHEEGKLSEVSERFAKFHASQCGFCTPGFVVACHAEVHNAAASSGGAGCGKVSSQQMRDALDGNLCRCTGYRPIVDACKSFAEDVDIEDLGVRCCSQVRPVSQLPADAVTLPSEMASAAQTSAPASGVERFELGSGTELLVPGSLTDLVSLPGVWSSASADSVRLIAGNTGVGIYKDWAVSGTIVDVNKVAEMGTLEVGAKQLEVGACVSLTRLASCLEDMAAGQVEGHHTGSAVGAWAGTVAAHVKRIGGRHVRNSATVGGNLVLAREKELPSDLTTLLAASGASVEVLKLDGSGTTATTTMAISDFLELPASAGRQLVVRVVVPLPGQSELFFSNRLGQRWSNSAALANVAIWLRTTEAAGGKQVAEARVVLGVNTADYHSVPPKGWCMVRCPGMEAALQGMPLGALTPALPAAVRALAGDMPAGVPPEVRASAEGMVAQGLMQVLGLTKADDTITTEGASSLDNGVNGSHAPDANGAAANGNGCCANGNGVHHHHDEPPAATAGAGRAPTPCVVRGKQSYPELDAAFKPMTQPLPKLLAELQTTGTAPFSEDIAVAKDALYAAWAVTEYAARDVVGIDTSPALAMPGVERVITAKDYPAGGNRALGGFLFPEMWPEPLMLAEGEHSEYAGQAVAMVLADSFSAAQRAAKAVVIKYGEPGKPLVTIQACREAGAYYPLPPIMQMPPGPSAGGMSAIKSNTDAEALKAAFESAPYVLRNQKYFFPSQQHFYLEPQSAVAEPDEGGAVTVTVACQSVNSIAQGVAATLGVPLNKVHLKTRRLGGSFGGKATYSQRVASGAALAATLTGRQVRFTQNRNIDMAMCGGRCDTEVEYDVAFDGQGRVLALDMRMYMMGAAYLHGGWCDPLLVYHTIGACYQLPAFQLEVAMTRGHVHPRTFMRAPGDLQGGVVTEAVLDVVAASLGLDGQAVRSANLLPPPGPDATSVKTCFGFELPAEQYIAPRILEMLAEKSDYVARVAAVKEFNAKNAWRKRGIAMVATRYQLGTSPQPAYVSVYKDGSVLVACHGVETGQGLFTKVAQTAAWTLSQLLPQGSEPISVGLIRVADSDTMILPNGGVTGGSTTSEMSCHSVRLACDQLVANLRPIADKLATAAGEASSGDAGTGAAAPVTWRAICEAAWGAFGNFFGASVPMSSFAYGGIGVPEYQVFGGGAVEVEVDALTGERRVLRADLLVDCGRSINPAVDIGQIEGAFVMGLGLCLSEEVVMDEQTGKLINNSTWNYKIPGVACVPQQLNVHILPDSPLLVKGPMAAKGVGEPPLLTMGAVLSAFGQATREARASMAALAAASPSRTGDAAAAVAATKTADGLKVAAAMQAPATIEAVRAACGDWSAADVLEGLIATVAAK